MWILLSYNKNGNKILIYNISLIKNENFETFDSIINYLKNNYQFEPKVMIVDFCKTAYKAFKTNYKNIRMFACFFHLMQRLTLHLPQLKDKNKTIKKKAKNLLAKMKLLFFINHTNIDEFFEKKKYIYRY